MDYTGEEMLIVDGEKAGMIAVTAPDSNARLFICPQVMFQFPGKMPNWWWRMWQYVLLGFRWKAAK